MEAKNGGVGGAGAFVAKGELGFGTERVAEEEGQRRRITAEPKRAQRKPTPKKCSAQAIDRVGVGGENAAANGARFE